jgi:hypothetical protein
VFTERLKSLPGYRGHNTQTRPKKLAREIKTGNLLSLDELSAEIDKLLNERNARSHSTTGRAPDSFYEGWKPVIPSKEYLSFLLMDRAFVKVRDGTVLVKGMLYRGDDLWQIAGERVEVRRDPKDLREAAIIYRGELFGFARLETPDHYRGPVTLEAVKACRRERQKIRKYRKAIIEKEHVIDDPVRWAQQVNEEEELKTRDIRPPASSVRSINQQSKLAREVIKGLKERVSEEERSVAVAGGPSILTRSVAAAKQSTQEGRPQIPKHRLVSQLSIDEPFHD